MRDMNEVHSLMGVKSKGLLTPITFFAESLGPVSEEVRGSPWSSDQPLRQCSDSSTVGGLCSAVLGSLPAAYPAPTQLPTVEVAS